MKKFFELRRQDAALIRLAAKMGNRPGAVRRLVEIYGSAMEVLERLDEVQKQHPELLRERDVEAILSEDVRDVYMRVAERMQKADLRVVSCWDDDYPVGLRAYADAPVVLYVAGQCERLRGVPLVCMVGTRKPSEYGQRLTREIGGALAERGAVLVSGMAHGTDALVAQVALEYSSADCKTVAAMPCGADVCYPASNRKLHEQILAEGMAISAFEPGTAARNFRFVQRNDLMAALCDCVIVTEGSASSGALITAERAIKRGKPLFALPGRVGDEMSEGPNMLLASGAARAVTCAEDVLSVIGYGSATSEKKSVKTVKPEAEAAKSSKPKATERRAKPKIDLERLTPTEREVMRLLRNGGKTFDELVEQGRLEMSMLNVALTSLELAGLLKQARGGAFEIFD